MQTETIKPNDGPTSTESVQGGDYVDRPVRRLYLRLEMPGCHGRYWHCRKRKKMPPLDLPRAEFLRSLWPNRGLTFGTACDVERVASRVRKAGKFDVECGTYHIVAYWKPND